MTDHQKLQFYKLLSPTRGANLVKSYINLEKRLLSPTRGANNTKFLLIKVNHLLSPTRGANVNAYFFHNST